MHLLTGMVSDRGIEIYSTERSNGYPVEVAADASCEVNRYGLVLVE